MRIVGWPEAVVGQATRQLAHERQRGRLGFNLGLADCGSVSSRADSCRESAVDEGVRATGYIGSG